MYRDKYRYRGGGDLGTFPAPTYNQFISLLEIDNRERERGRERERDRENHSKVT